MAVVDEDTQTAAGVVNGLRFGVVGVADTERALDFYCGVLEFKLLERQGMNGQGSRCLLTSGHRFLVLQELADQPAKSTWVRDDLQVGMRHIGLKVDNVDRWAERVREAGARFTIEPEDAFGDVRLCFFLDPDGTHLEFIQGNVNYSTVGSPILVERERAVPVPTSPRFDHVAVSVADLETTLAFYTGQLGFPIIGELREDKPAQGFTITYLQAGPGILEIFSFTEPMLANSFNPAAQAPGLLYLGLDTDDVRGAVAHLEAAGAAPVEAIGVHGPDSALLTDAHGTPLELSRAPAPR